MEEKIFHSRNQVNCTKIGIPGVSTTGHLTDMSGLGMSDINLVRPLECIGTLF